MAYYNIHEQPQSITCPNCGRDMRLNYVSWKEPKYVCDSFRREDDCGMIITVSDEMMQYDPIVSA